MNWGWRTTLNNIFLSCAILLSSWSFLVLFDTVLSWVILPVPYVHQWSYLVVGDKGCIGPSKKLLCLCLTQKIMQHMYGTIPYLFACWADPVVHLLLLKSSCFQIALFSKILKVLHLNDGNYYYFKKWFRSLYSVT